MLSMTPPTSPIGSAFLARQKASAHRIAAENASRAARRRKRGASANAETRDQAREYEDDAQRLAALELEGNLKAADENRLSNIERALQKIEDGTLWLVRCERRHRPERSGSRLLT